MYSRNAGKGPAFLSAQWGVGGCEGVGTGERGKASHGEQKAREIY